MFHIGYYKSILNTLQNICKSCSRVLLPEEERRSFLAKMRYPLLDGLQKKSLVKRIHDRCRKTTICPYCNAFNGSVKKAGALKIIHERYCCVFGRPGLPLTSLDAATSRQSLARTSPPRTARRSRRTRS